MILVALLKGDAYWLGLFIFSVAASIFQYFLLAV